MLRCIEQSESEGGEGHWVDSFHVAHLLHQEDPESFNILAHTQIAMRNITETNVGHFHTFCHRNVIRSVISIYIIDASKFLHLISTMDSKI